MKTRMKLKTFGIRMILLSMINTKSFSQYIMPAETEEHEGTWLQWPHHYEYGISYRNRLDATWVAMTGALVGSENVHIIAYNSTEQDRITNLLTNAGISLTNIDFKLFPTNDVWVRDNGPVFVRDSAGNLLIEDWGFNGWGGDYNFNHDNTIPSSVATAIGLPVVNLNSSMIVEGGSIEMDGNGVLMATKSSILTQTNSNGALAIRNPGMTQSQAEAIFKQYLGVSKFIWLDGFLSADDITDAHIDGFAKFANDSTLVTMSNADLAYWGLSSTDIATLYDASNVNDLQYNKVYVPLTLNNVVTTYGNNLGYKGSYCNYYIANNVVLVPNYNDPNDAIANAIIQELHPNRTVVGIDVRNLFETGGMIHCVTQQQPIEQNISSINTIENSEIKISEIYPNPTNTSSVINIILKEKSSVELLIYDIQGKKVVSKHETLQAGNNTFEIDTSRLKSGTYTYLIRVNNDLVKSDKLIMK